MVLATYRVQLHAGFAFADLQQSLAYLHRLGITHLYLSPIFRSRPGSPHGYDVIDHGQIDPELGGREGFESLVAACRELGVDPKATLFLGDDRRDVQSGQSAGSLTWVAAWGYLPSGCSPHDWGADGVADQPLDLLQAIAAGPLATSQA